MREPAAAGSVDPPSVGGVFAIDAFLGRNERADESPFRVLVVDDPVQSMDPSKVDGLAQVLPELTEHRQVIVFTHDNRLPETIRRLGVEATICQLVEPCRGR